MKRVFIHAYAAGNLGDDLMIRILCTRYPNVRFYLYADAVYKSRFKDIKNLKVYAPSDSYVVYMDRFLNKIKHTEMGLWKFLIRRSNATVHIGGSVFTQHEDNYAAALHLDFELCRLSHLLYVVGANFGPFTDDNYYKDYQKLFAGYKDICFRDRYSYELHKNLPNVRYAPDVVFNYKTGHTCRPKKQVLISPIYMENRGGKYSICQYTESYMDFLVHISLEFLNLEYDVKFISFCAFQQDDQAIALLLERLKKEAAENSRPNIMEHVSACYYDQNMTECLQAFEESELVIGTRFHSVILGWLYGKRTLPVVYDNKTVQVLKDNHVNDYITLEETKHFTAADIGQITRQLIDSTPADISDVVKASAAQFAGLDKLLR